MTKRLLVRFTSLWGAIAVLLLAVSYDSVHGFDNGTSYDSPPGGTLTPWNGGQVDNDIDMSQGTGRLLLPQLNCSTPALAFGNPNAFDTGITRSLTTGFMTWCRAGTGRFQLTGSGFDALDGVGPRMTVLATSETTAVHRPSKAANSGIGGLPNGGSFNVLINGVTQVKCTDTASAYCQWPRQENTAPTEPVACTSDTRASEQYVDDTNDGAPAAFCRCVDLDGGGGGSFDWRRSDNEAVACPFY